ncbi:hypothetical protein MMC14_002034 [Varicellaria rhodocarpa]|nr:hypothetical protein [Varicellaria rhodocarpa]
MPPKKRARVASNAASKGTPDEGILRIADKPSSAKDAATSSAMLSSWTDEQEISLFKGMIRWKPVEDVGMHKHFRMIALSQYLRNHGYNPEKEVHTRIPGIWKKLGGLYNLQALDDREDSFGEINSDESDPSKEGFFDFQLPSDDFKSMMFARRLAPAGSSSPVVAPSYDGRDEPPRASTVDDSEEPRSLPASTRGTKLSRGPRASKIGRKSRLQVQLTPREKSGSSATPEARNERNEKGEEEAEDDEGDEDEDENHDDEGTPSSTTRAVRGVGRPPRRGRGRGGRRRGGRRK